MEIVLELIVELLIEGGIEISANRRISRWIRYPIASLLILFFASIIFGILFLGILLWKENIWGALFLIVIGLWMLFGSIKKYKQIYQNKNSSEQKEKF